MTLGIYYLLKYKRVKAAWDSMSMYYLRIYEGEGK